MEVKELGQNLVDLRKKKNMTQKDLAKKLNISSQLISKWETGQATPSVEYLLDLCDIFCVSLDYLVGNKVKSARKTSKKKFKLTKPWIYTLYSLGAVAYIVAMVFLSIYCYIPLLCKDKYLEEIGQSSKEYFQGDYFNVQLIGKIDGEQEFAQYYLYNKDENGVDLKVYGSDIETEELIIDGVKYYGYNSAGGYALYREEYDLGEISTSDLFYSRTSEELESKDLNFSKKDIKYIRRVENGFKMIIDSDILSKELDESGKKMYEYDNMDCNVKIKKDGSMEVKMSVIMTNKIKKEDYLVEVIMDVMKERPEIKWYSDTPWLQEESQANDDFASQVYGEENVEKLSVESEELKALKTAIKNKSYYEYDNKLFITYTDTKTYLKSYDLSNMTLLETKEISAFDSFIFYKDQLITFKNNKMYKNALSNMQSAEIEISLGFTLGSNYILRDNMLVTTSSSDYVFYNIESEKEVAKSDRACFSMSNSYVKENYIYGVDVAYSDNTGIIYRYDILTGQETVVASELANISKVVLVTDGGDIYYSSETTYDTYKLGAGAIYTTSNYSERFTIGFENNGRLYFRKGAGAWGIEILENEESVGTTYFDFFNEIIYQDEQYLVIKDENQVFYIQSGTLCQISRIRTSGTYWNPYTINCDGSILFAKDGNCVFAFNINDITRSIALITPDNNGDGCQFYVTKELTQTKKEILIIDDDVYLISK